MFAPISNLQTRAVPILRFGAALLAAASALRAQDPADTLSAADTLPRVVALDEIVAVGTRRGGRTAIESYSPVHVVSGANVRAQGAADLLDMLRTVVPAFSVNAQPIGDGATIVRPPNVRNLAADHTLVLVNGKRRHRGAVIAWLVPKASEGAQWRSSRPADPLRTKRRSRTTNWACPASGA